MFQIQMSHHHECPTFRSLPALLIGRASRRLLRQEEGLRRPGEEAVPGKSAPAESAVRVSRRGRGFRPAKLAPASPPRVREASSPRAPLPPRREPSPSPSLTSWLSYSPLSFPEPARHPPPPPGHMQLSCIGALLELPLARMQQIATLPSHRAGNSRPGCWNCGVFGHSWVDCQLPRLRFCRLQELEEDPAA